MTKLSDTQLVILDAACQRPNRIVLPLPERLKGGAAQKVVGALLARGLIAEVEAGRGDPVWREAGDGKGVTLVATDAALQALGIEAASGPTAASTAAPAPAESLVPAEAPQPPASHPAPLRRKTREGTKQAQLIAMLRRAEGATIAQIVEATGWQPHTVRGALAGALKKRLGLTSPPRRSRARAGLPPSACLIPDTSDCADAVLRGGALIEPDLCAPSVLSIALTRRSALFAGSDLGGSTGSSSLQSQRRIGIPAG